MSARGVFGLVLAALLGLGGLAGAQELTLRTTYGGVAANADRVLVTGEDGRWREARGADGHYRIDIGSPRYSLAVVCFEPAGPHVRLYRFFLAELAELSHDCAGRSDLLAPRYRVRGEVVAFSDRGGQGAGAGTLPTMLSVHHGRLQLSAVAGFNTSFNTPVPGNLGSDLLALQSLPGQPPERAVLHRNVDLSGSPRFMFDMGAADAVELDVWRLVVEAGGSLDAEEAPRPQTISLAARLLTCGGTVVAMAPGALTQVLPGLSAETLFASLPPEAREPCDAYELTAMELLGSESLRLAAALTAEPQDTTFVLPPTGPEPVIDTVGSEPLRARIAWSPDMTAAFLVGGLTDGSVTWSFVQSPSAPPSITLPPWGADAGVPALRGGSYRWHFGAVRTSGTLADALSAYSQSEWLGQLAVWGPAAAELSYQVWLTGGLWVPLAIDLPGSR